MGLFGKKNESETSSAGTSSTSKSNKKSSAWKDMHENNNPSFLGKCFKTALAAAGIYAGAGLIKSMYEEFTDSKFKFDSTFGDDNQIGVERIKDNVYVGESTRGNEFDNVIDTSASNSVEFE